MKLLHKTSAELTAALRDAHGAKRRRILRALQRRWVETTPRSLSETTGLGAVPYYNFELLLGEPKSAVRTQQSEIAR